MKDNRQHPRYRIPDAWVACHPVRSPSAPPPFTSSESRLRVLDISAHGVGFTTNAMPPAEGTEIHLKVGLPGDRHTFEVRGTVAWTKQKGEAVASDVSSIWGRSTIGQAMMRRDFGVGVAFRECPRPLAHRIRRMSHLAAQQQGAEHAVAAC